MERSGKKGLFLDGKPVRGGDWLMKNFGDASFLPVNNQHLRLCTGSTVFPGGRCLFTGNSDTCVHHHGRTAECFHFFFVYQVYQGIREAKPHGIVAQRTKQMPRQGPEIPDRASRRCKFLSLPTEWSVLHTSSVRVPMPTTPLLLPSTT